MIVDWEKTIKFFNREINYENLQGWTHMGPRNISASWYASGSNYRWAEGGVENLSAEGTPDMSSNSVVCGAIETIWCHPSNSNILLCGPVGGGVFKTKNANAGKNIHWELKSDEIIGITKINSDIFDSNNLVAVGGESSALRTLVFPFSGYNKEGILVSEDQGETWNLKKIALDVDKNEIEYLDLNDVVVWDKNILVSAHRYGSMMTTRSHDEKFNKMFGKGGLFFSPDFGNNWVHLDITTNGDPVVYNKLYQSIPSMEITYYENKVNIYVCILGDGIYRWTQENSFDVLSSSSIWTKVSYGTLDYAIRKEGTYWPAIFGNATTDLSTYGSGITSWKSNNNIFITTSKNNQNYVYVMTVNNSIASGFFYSSDSGTTWTEVDLPRTIGGASPYHNNMLVISEFYDGLQPITKKDGTPKTSSKYGGQGEIHGSLTAHPDNPNIVFVGGDRQPSAFAGNLMNARVWSGRLFRGDLSKSSTIESAGNIAELLREGYVYNTYSESFSHIWSHITHTNEISGQNAKGSNYNGLEHGGTVNGSAPHADSRCLMIDASGNLVEGDDGGICKLKEPLDKTKSKWYSLCGDLCAFETHNVAFDHINNIVLIGTQDNGNMIGNSIRGYSIQPTGDGGNVQIYIDNLNNIFYERSSQNRGGFSISVKKQNEFFDVEKMDKNLIYLESSDYSKLNVSGRFVPTVEKCDKDPLRRAEVSGFSKIERIIYDADAIINLPYNENDQQISRFLDISNNVTKLNNDYGLLINNIKYTQNSDKEDIIYAITNNFLYIIKEDSNGIVTDTELLRSHNLQKYTFEGIEYRKNFTNLCITDKNVENNIFKIAITTGSIIGDGGYMNFDDPLNSNAENIPQLELTNIYQDNSLIILETDNTNAGTFVKKEVNLNYNQLQCCVYLNDSVFVGHSQGVIHYDINRDVVTEVYPTGLGNKPVSDMEYNSFKDLLVIATLGGGAYILGNASKYVDNINPSGEILCRRLKIKDVFSQQITDFNEDREAFRKEKEKLEQEELERRKAEAEKQRSKQLKDCIVIHNIEGRYPKEKCCSCTPNVIVAKNNVLAINNSNQSAATRWANKISGNKKSSGRSPLYNFKIFTNSCK